MTLLQAKEKSNYRLEKLDLSYSEKVRLTSLGVKESSTIEVVSKELGTVTIKVDGSVYTFDESVAKDIKIKEIQ